MIQNEVTVQKRCNSIWNSRHNRRVLFKIEFQGFRKFQTLVNIYDV